MFPQAAAEGGRKVATRPSSLLSCPLVSTSPTATGSLAKTPFPQLIVYIVDRALTGSLVFRNVEDDEVVEHTVYIEEGAVAKVRTGKPVAYLGQVLVDLGLLDEDGLETSLITLAASKGGLHGELLLRTGRIDRGGLLAGLREQIIRKMTYLFSLPPETQYAFFEGVNRLEDWGGPELLPVDPLRLLWLSVRTSQNFANIDALLMRLRKTPLRLRPDTDLARFGFDAEALAVVDRLQGEPMLLGDLLGSSVAPEMTTKLVVVTLAISRHLDFGNPKQPPPLCANHPAELYRAVRVARSRSAGGQAAVGRVKLQTRLMPADGKPRPVPSSGPPSPRPSEPTRAKQEEVNAVRESILERASGIDKEDYFTMLGVTRDANEDEIRAAYFGLVKRWHPDRLPAELGDVRDAAAKVFARIHQAFDTLVDAEQRAQYLQVLEGGGGTPEEAEEVQRILDAADAFQRAQVFLKKRDIDQAELYAERAMNGDPEQADYIAFWVSIQLQKRASDPNAPMADLLKLLDDALAKDSACERALFCRGTLLKRIGRVEAAMSDFRKVVELYPKNIDAARELRLYEMRKGSSSSSSSTAAPSQSAQWRMEALLGKLFKR